MYIYIGAMTAAEISEYLNLHSIKDHNWHIQPCCALTGVGLTEGLDYVSIRTIFYSQFFTLNFFLLSNICNLTL